MPHLQALSFHWLNRCLINNSKLHFLADAFVSWGHKIKEVGQAQCSPDLVPGLTLMTFISNSSSLDVPIDKVSQKGQQVLTAAPATSGVLSLLVHPHNYFHYPLTLPLFSPHFYLPDMSISLSYHQYLHYSSVLGNGHFIDTNSYQDLPGFFPSQFSLFSIYLYLYLFLFLFLSPPSPESERRWGEGDYICSDLKPVFSSGSFFSLPNVLSISIHITPNNSMIIPVLPWRWSGS